MSREHHGPPPASVMSGPLDAIAYAGVNVLGAAQVIVAVTPPHGRRDESGKPDAIIKGSHSVTGPSLNGRRVVLAPGIPTGAVTVVDRHDDADGSVRLTPVSDAGSRQGRALGSRQPLLLAKAGEVCAVVLVEAPGRVTLEGIARTLETLLEVAAQVEAAERRISLTRLRSGLQQREEERRRWARELHDETLQQMGALQVLLTSTLRSAGAPSRADDIEKALRTASDMLNAQIIGLRHLITELRPATLDQLGLSPPLFALARRTEELTGMPVSVHLSLRYADGQLSTRLLPDVEVAVYRVVQEALTNASRHSGATRARISVVEDDDEVCVEISDNGTGISGGLTAPGFGITGMQERALLAGGQLHVLSGVIEDGDQGARGTMIRLVVPAAHRVEAAETVSAESAGSTSAGVPQP